MTSPPPSSPSPPSVVLGVGGSIAAYKSIYLARLMVEAGMEVWPVLTASATRFVGALSFSALCGRRAVTDLWHEAEAGSIGHVELGARAAAVVIAPCTADLLARLAQGRADDPLAAVTLSTRAPVLIAPAMESGMWENPATRDNVARLRQRGVRFVEPAAGPLASGRAGSGRMAEPDVILEATQAILARQDLAGRRCLITAGPTREFLDPARFISNPSTGKMGFAIARAARRRGAQVTLIAGPTALVPPWDVTALHVTTTAEMLAACQGQLPDHDVWIMAAAPVDFRPTTPSAQKVKKGPAPHATRVEFETTADILSTLAPASRHCTVIGFAAESEGVVEHAREKLARKGLDLIVANDISRVDAGFATDTNAVTLIDAAGEVTEIPLASKHAVADLLLDWLAAAPRRGLRSCT